ncbi:MAG: DUF4450 domain-containing protein, partial [Mangrovibacterium sp.]
MKRHRFFFLLLFVVYLLKPAFAQTLRHEAQRKLRYRPEGHDFVIVNGSRRFNRALYGSNSGFRAEAGDLPEFALYMPGMGGTLKLGLLAGEQSKWLTEAGQLEARYRAGTMCYTILDPLLGEGKLELQVLALHGADGMILKLKADGLPGETELFWVYGGATGKRFSREGDLGADPESVFYLKPEYCADNTYFTGENGFTLYYGSGRSLSDNELYENHYRPTQEELSMTRLKEKKRIVGRFFAGSDVRIGDASRLKSPLQADRSEDGNAPVVMGRWKPGTEAGYFLLMDPDSGETPEGDGLAELFRQADQACRELAGRLKINTPDPYVNAAASVLTTAADAIWDGQSYMHGAVAWRMPLPGWRGAYAADWLGWHDRARTHFRGYFQAQYNFPPSGPSVPDTATNLARQKEVTGTALFTEGYISRRPGKLNNPSHYDMNLVFVSQLLKHFRWTGDLGFLRESWPVLERHLAWEKRNFDADDDGLYDAYCCIWASDALQYRGGGVTHSSAYNYQANLAAAELAPLIGQDPEPYREEAEKIRKAVHETLWMSGKGWYAEYRDLLGNRLLHPAAALWTVYHAIDEGLADPFRAWQSVEYVNREIPHIPVEAEELPANTYYTLSTTNWMPYTWSINNVAMAEVLHTSLACWQAGKQEMAFDLLKSSLLDYMFLGSSPGNFGQLSYYDA